MICSRIGAERFRFMDMQGVNEADSCRKALNKFLNGIGVHSIFRYFKTVKEKIVQRADFVVYRQATANGYKAGLRLEINPKYKFLLSELIQEQQ